MKFVELIIEVILREGSINAYFGRNDFELLIDGYPLDGSMSGGVLNVGERVTDTLVFQIDEEVTEFEFLYDLDCCTDGIEPQRVLVTLPPVEG